VSNCRATPSYPAIKAIKTHTEVKKGRRLGPGLKQNITMLVVSAVATASVALAVCGKNYLFIAQSRLDLA
jgi:hypothetical protein